MSKFWALSELQFVLAHKQRLLTKVESQLVYSGLYLLVFKASIWILNSSLITNWDALSVSSNCREAGNTSYFLLFCSRWPPNIKGVYDAIWWLSTRNKPGFPLTAGSFWLSSRQPDIWSRFSNKLQSVVTSEDPSNLLNLFLSSSSQQFLLYFFILWFPMIK